MRPNAHRPVRGLCCLVGSGGMLAREMPAAALCTWTDDMATEPSGILVPAYDRPGDLSDWDPAFAAAPYLWPRRLIVVANDNNGPGYNFVFDGGVPVAIDGY